MSVQAGVWNRDRAPVDREVLAAISRATSANGLDAEELYVNGEIGMLYRPFHTTAQSRTEQQPLRKDCGATITWDGRLDNGPDLISELAIAIHGSVSDIDIVASAFERWGIDFFERLRGDWAISIWDAASRKLILARDYIGSRRLYYYAAEHTIIWCTYLKPLASLPNVSLCINDDYVAGYLARFPSATSTPYRDISAVPPGSVVSFRQGTTEVCRYWSLRPKRLVHYKTDTEYEEHFRAVFRQSVKRRLRADSPILAELSGGLDSSAVVCMADDVLRNNEVDAPRVDTLSLYDPRLPRADERNYIHKVEEWLGKKGHHINVAELGDDFFCASSGSFLTAPGPSDQLQGTRAYVFSLVQKHGYRVVLNGLGGDELLGDLLTLQALAADLLISVPPAQLIKRFKEMTMPEGLHWAHLLYQALGKWLPDRLRLLFSTSPKVEDWIDPAFAKRKCLAIRREGPRRTFGYWRPSRREYARAIVSTRRYLAFCPPHVLQNEERRYPLLDQDLLEFLISIPATQLCRPGQSRSLMRRALRGIVPDDVLWRRTKGGGSPSLALSFQDNYAALLRQFASPLSGTMGYIDIDHFIGHLHKAKAGDSKSLMLILKGLYLEVWLRGVVSHGVVSIPDHHGERRVVAPVSEVSS